MVAIARQLTNPAAGGENRGVASPQHVGLWRSLGARFHGMEEVVGSIPTRSTNQSRQSRRLSIHGQGCSCQTRTLKDDEAMPCRIDHQRSSVLDCQLAKY